MSADTENLAALDHAIEQARLAFQGLLQKKWDLTGIEPIEGAAYLPQDLLLNAELLRDRDVALNKFSGFSRIMEVGTWQGTFAKLMWEAIHPDEFHILDINLSRFDRDYFKDFIGNRVVLHEGNSVELLPTFADNSFDFIYVDGDHTYDGASQDLQHAYDKVKPGGFIGVNDYTNWCANLAMEFGVMKAANDLITSKRLQVRYFALHHQGNHDVFLQKM
jgi:hypothetical protein